MRKNPLLCEKPHCRERWMLSAGDDEGKPWRVHLCDEHFWLWAEDNPWVYAVFGAAISLLPGGLKRLSPSRV